VNLKSAIRKTKAKSVTLSMIGTGAGGLQWKDVKPLVDKALADSPADVQIVTKYTKNVPPG
jgi:hypothetical protein